MNTLQIQDAFQPYYAGRKTSVPLADNSNPPPSAADKTDPPAHKGAGKDDSVRKRPIANG